MLVANPKQVQQEVKNEELRKYILFLKRTLDDAQIPNPVVRYNLSTVLTKILILLDMKDPEAIPS